jgi:hypothetical protein
MAEHWNIQINIQKVSPGQPKTPVMRGLVEQPKTQREVVSVLELKVTAETEAEAYDKAHRMLEANYPEPTRIQLPDYDDSSPEIQLPMPPVGLARPVRDAPQA